MKFRVLPGAATSLMNDLCKGCTNAAKGKRGENGGKNEEKCPDFAQSVFFINRLCGFVDDFPIKLG